MNRRVFNLRAAATLISTSVIPSAVGQAASDDVQPARARYKLSVMLWTVFQNLPFEQRLEKVAEAGYKYVELVGEYEKWTDGDFARINARRRQLGIAFDCTAGIRHSLCDPSERNGLLAEISRTLTIMERIDCPALILLTGNVIPGMTVEAQHQSCIDGLRAASRVIEGKKINGEPVRLLLENIDPEENPQYFLTSVARGFEIVRVVDHPQVKFLYDFFHEQIAEGNLIEKLEKNIDLVGLVHVADVPGRHQPGTGEINYSNIFRKLVELKYDKIVAMEFLPTGDAVAQLRAARLEAEAPH